MFLKDLTIAYTGKVLYRGLYVLPKIINQIYKPSYNYPQTKAQAGAYS